MGGGMNPAARANFAKSSEAGRGSPALQGVLPSWPGVVDPAPARIGSTDELCPFRVL